MFGFPAKINRLKRVEDLLKQVLDAFCQGYNDTRDGFKDIAKSQKILIDIMREFNKAMGSIEEQLAKITESQSATKLVLQDVATKTQSVLDKLKELQLGRLTPEQQLIVDQIVTTQTEINDSLQSVEDSEDAALTDAPPTEPPVE